MSELFRNPERDRSEARQLEAIRRHNRTNLKALLMTLAIVIAPFLALVFSLEAALVVLAAALLFTTWLTLATVSQVATSQRTTLKVAAGLNFVILLVVVLILAVRVTP